MFRYFPLNYLTKLSTHILCLKLNIKKMLTMIFNQKKQRFTNKNDIVQPKCRKRKKQMALPDGLNSH